MILFLCQKVSSLFSQPELSLPKLTYLRLTVICRCLEGDCHRDGQLFGFLDEFITGPQESPISLPKDASGHLTPIVIWHGLGQTCCEPLSMGRVKNIIANITKAYVVSIKVWLNKLVLDSLRSCVRRNLIIKWVGFS